RGGKARVFCATRAGDATRRADPQPVFQFSSQGAEGTYNATLALLPGKNEFVDYRAERSVDDDQPPPMMHAPPSWIMAVSHGMLWPVDMRRSTPQDTAEYVVRTDDR